MFQISNTSQEGGRPTRPARSTRSYSLDLCNLSMGITGLLKELKPVTEKRNIKEYRNRRIAIDGYAWLHKAVFGCCVELATGVESTKWISYCLRLIDMLLDNQIVVHMVFDGANLPAKDGVEKVRAESRKKALESGLKLLNSDNKSDRDLARRHLVGAVDVTPFMAGQLIKVLREQRQQVLSSFPFLQWTPWMQLKFLLWSFQSTYLMDCSSPRCFALLHLMRRMPSFPISVQKDTWMPSLQKILT